mgnify:CR=1 FL=1
MDKYHRGYKSLVIIFASFFISIALLYVYVNSLENLSPLDEAALSEGTTGVRGIVNGKQVHCANSNDAAKCLENINKEKIILWLGNSQLHSINQIMANDQPAPALLHDMMLNSNYYVLTFSQANANLQEHLILLTYMVERFNINTLLLPVVFDDLRETGVRTSIMNFFNDFRVPPTSSDFVKSLISQGAKSAQFDEFTDDGSGSNSGALDLGGLDGTPQMITEEYLSNELSKLSKIWKMQGLMRGNLLIGLYKFRNYVFGISASTKRKIIPSRYAKNMEALSEILLLANSNNLDTLVYIPPLRDDYERPYDDSEYELFKTEVERITKVNNIRFSDIEGLVPNEIWGMKNSTTINPSNAEELDFMHFQGGGHELLANKIYSLIHEYEKDGNTL